MEDSEAEASPLLRSEGRVSKRQASYYLGETVSAQNADLLLLVCCFITGLIDASSYNAWSVFMGMQTGTSQPSSHRTSSTYIANGRQPRQHNLPRLEHRKPSPWLR